jgi:hypothetical protein
VRTFLLKFLFVALTFLLLPLKAYADTPSLTISPVLIAPTDLKSYPTYTANNPNLAFTITGCTENVPAYAIVYDNDGQTVLLETPHKPATKGGTTVNAGGAGIPKISPDALLHAYAYCANDEGPEVAFYTDEEDFKPKIEINGADINLNNSGYSSTTHNPIMQVTLTNCKATPATVDITVEGTGTKTQKTGTVADGRSVIPLGFFTEGFYLITGSCGPFQSDQLSLTVVPSDLPRLDWDDADGNHQVNETEKVTMTAQFCADTDVIFSWKSASYLTSIHHSPPIPADDKGFARYTKLFIPGTNYIQAECGGKKTTELSIQVTAEISPPPPPPPGPPCAIGKDISNNVVNCQDKKDEEVTACRMKIVSCTTFNTAIGNVNTDAPAFIIKLFAILLSLAGGIDLLINIRAGYKLMTSQGNPEAVKAAREELTSALIGLMFLIFSLVILEVIGVDILHIPGFGR